MLRPSLPRAEWDDHAEFIAGAVRVLLGHYFDPGHHATLIEEMTADWIDVLEPFSVKCISEARRRWIANERRRPTPADIKAMCFQIAAGK
jgi:hypothetical protein